MQTAVCVGKAVEKLALPQHPLMKRNTHPATIPDARG
jgi:hypothetical protein